MAVQTNSLAWWEEKSDSVGDHCLAAFKIIDGAQKNRHTRNLVYLRLYENEELNGLYVSAALPSLRSLDAAVGSRVTFNVVASCVDTLVNRIGKNKPRPQFVTDDGDWYARQKAEVLNEAVDGIFYQAKTYEEVEDAFSDALIWDMGVVKVFSDNGTVRTERVVSDEIVVDEGDGMYGRPRTIYQRQYIHRETLLRQFKASPRKAAAIRNAAGFDLRRGVLGHGDRILCVESWHLPSTEEAGEEARVSMSVISEDSMAASY
jgi:hypothetical protein